MKSGGRLPKALSRRLSHCLHGRRFQKGGGVDQGRDLRTAGRFVAKLLRKAFVRPHGRPASPSVSLRWGRHVGDPRGGGRRHQHDRALRTGFDFALGTGSEPRTSSLQRHRGVAAFELRDDSEKSFHGRLPSVSVRTSHAMPAIGRRLVGLVPSDLPDRRRRQRGSSAACVRHNQPNCGFRRRIRRPHFAEGFRAGS